VGIITQTEEEMMDNFYGDDPNEGGKPQDQNTVGYRRPPKHSRFKKGQSGNPGGRPKLRKPPPLSRPGETLSRVLGETMTITINGRPQRVPVMDALITTVVHSALRGDIHAQRLLFRLLGEWDLPWEEPVRGGSTALDEFKRRLNQTALRMAELRKQTA
jgi:hypothetical protein